MTTFPEKILGIAAQQMAQTPQNPLWHGEGDVLTHTHMVLDALEHMPAFLAAPDNARQALRLAAVLHDIGKIRTTRLEDGQWVSPGHSRVSAEWARQILWQDLGLCGTAEKQWLRETVCNLVRYHAMPPHVISHVDGSRRLRRAACNGQLLPGFTMELLCILAEADALGRICQDQQDILERIQLCRELAKEAGCLDGPGTYFSEHAQFAYLSGRNVQPDQPLYDDSWGQVILMAGLPGTGKDTWIQTHCPDIPMISLDEIRKEQNISPKGNQTKVVEIARERAKAYLRQHQRFVWNATNLTPMIRQKQVELFSDYGASVQVVYLETSWQEQCRRNRERKDAVPDAALWDMLQKLSPPERWEAHQVRWEIV